MSLTKRFKRFNLIKQLTTYENEDGEEKKIKDAMPKGWNTEDIYTDEANLKLNGVYGYGIKTGKANNITVLDYDHMNLYEADCKLYPDLHQHYKVKTKNGIHV